MRRPLSIFCDCTTAFDRIPDPVFIDAVHFEDRGHDAMAARLLPAIAEALGL